MVKHGLIRPLFISSLISFFTSSSFGVVIQYGALKIMVALGISSMESSVALLRKSILL